MVNARLAVGERSADRVLADVNDGLFSCLLDLCNGSFHTFALLASDKVEDGSDPFILLQPAQLPGRQIAQRIEIRSDL